MQTIVILVPGLFGTDEVTSGLRRSPALNQLRERSSLQRIRVETTSMPEGSYLGLRPDVAQMPQGPLTVAALGAEPPDRSTHFHITPLSLEDGLVSPVAGSLTWDDLQVLWPLVEKLNTKTLTLLRGVDRDHALVWEGRGDLATTDPADLRAEWVKQMPEGDAEVLLRRLIDDSANLLDGIEWNDRRREEGLSPVSLLWPWGHGMRAKVPNLLLKRGQVATVLSNSIRLQGLSRLAGYRHLPYQEMGRGLETPFDWLAGEIQRHNQCIVLLDGPQEFRRRDQEEELDWWLREFSYRLLQPLLDAQAVDSEIEITLIGTNQTEGLALTPAGTVAATNDPFDERTLAEGTKPKADLNSVVDEALMP
ncbi:MAG: hypothetical protein ACOYON_03215 [Fimbriimonas sp.]